MRYGRDIPSGGLVIRYADKSAIIYFYLIGLVVLGLAMGYVYYNDTAIEYLRRLSVDRDERRTLLFGFSLFLIAGLTDLALQIRAFLIDRPALVIDDGGVSGLHGGLWRRIAWADIHDIEVSDGAIRFVRRPRNAVSRFFFRLYAKSRRARPGEYAIHVLIRRTDMDMSGILSAVAKYRPDLV